jgi:hypothetical protein
MFFENLDFYHMLLGVRNGHAGARLRAPACRRYCLNQDETELRFQPGKTGAGSLSRSGAARQDADHDSPGGGFGGSLSESGRGLERGLETLINEALRQHVEGKAPKLEETLRRVLREEMRAAS